MRHDMSPGGWRSVVRPYAALVYHCRDDVDGNRNAVVGRHLVNESRVSVAIIDGRETAARAKAMLLCCADADSV